MPRFFVFIILTISLLGWSFVIDKPLQTDTFRVRGSFKVKSSDEKVKIRIFNLNNGKIRNIDYFKNKFDFSVPVNGCYILTLNDSKKQGKSIFINTMLRKDLEKRQNFIVIVDLTSKTLELGDEPYVSSCSGVIKYSRRTEKFYYARKQLTISEVKKLAKEEKMMFEERKAKAQEEQPEKK